MRRKVSFRLWAVTAVILACSAELRAQAPAMEWRHIGNALLDLGLASPASGPVDRVWYSDDGNRLYAKTHSGRFFVTEDFEQWRAAKDVAEASPARDSSGVLSSPEPVLRLRQAVGGARVYAVGKAVYRTDDNGESWSNLTTYRGAALLGNDLADLAASPSNPDEVTVAGATGIWRSVDGGLSWTGLNQTLPNLPVRKIAAVPNGVRGVRIVAGSSEFEWSPGEKSAWQPVDYSDLAAEDNRKASLSRIFGVTISAMGASGSYVYAGSADGRIWSSSDKGESWTGLPDRLSSGISSIYVNPRDGRIALAALGNRIGPNTGSKATHVVRTMNGGIFWDDVTANLPDAAARGIVADFGSGAVYVASDAGVFVTLTDLASAGRPTLWTPLPNTLTPAAAVDVKMDAGANQLFVAFEGQGIYTTIAPHRMLDIRLVSAADLSSRATAPGGLLSVIGARVQSGQYSDTPVPVLDSNDRASQIQVPFTASGSSVSLSLQAANGRLDLGMPLLTASPAIFVDPDGSPLIIDTESGFLLDRSKPARAKTRIQILATGLGRVQPDWPAGVAAPLANPPRVAAPVRVFLNRMALEVTAATLAPGYIGSYLVEVEIPAIVDAGPAELWMEMQGQSSNHVRLYLAQ